MFDNNITPLVNAMKSQASRSGDEEASASLIVQVGHRQDVTYISELM